VLLKAIRVATVVYLIIGASRLEALNSNFGTPKRSKKENKYDIIRVKKKYHILAGLIAIFWGC
jgi:hypothetical protein